MANTIRCLRFPGFSGKQLGEVLGLSPQSFLHHFRQCPGIHREKHDGVFIYFSDVDEVYEKQLQERTFVAVRSAISTLSDPEAVLILVAIIRQHGISAEQILALPEIKKSKIMLSAVKGFIAYHGILKKPLIRKPLSPITSGHLLPNRQWGSVRMGMEHSNPNYSGVLSRKTVLSGFISLLKLGSPCLFTVAAIRR